MHWNHRVVDFSDENDGEPWVEVCEVFYDKNHEPYLYTARGVGVMGEDLEEVKQNLYKMLDCLNKPVLMKADFNQNIKVWMDADTDQTD